MQNGNVDKTDEQSTVQHWATALHCVYCAATQRALHGVYSHRVYRTECTAPSELNSVCTANTKCAKRRTVPQS